MSLPVVIKFLLIVNKILLQEFCVITRYLPRSILLLQKILIMCLYHYFSLLLTIIEVNSKYYIAMTKDNGYVISANANDLLESVERYFVQLWPRKPS